MANAKDIRSKIIGTPAKPGRVVSLDIGGEKLEVELREPSIALKGEIARLATSNGAKDPDLAKFTAHTIARCSYVPGTTERIFKTSDVQVLLALGPELDPLAQAALEVIGASKKTAAEVADLGNGSGATQS